MSARIDLRVLLAKGKHALSRGHVSEVVTLIEAQPRLAARLLDLLWDDDPGVVQRAADVLERVTHKPPLTLSRILVSSKESLLGLLPEAHLKKLRWNLALTLGRLPLTVPECRRAATAYYAYLEDSSSIVKTAALHGLADLTRHDPALLPAVLDLLRIHSRSGTPAMRARSRILLKRLEAHPVARPIPKPNHRTG